MNNKSMVVFVISIFVCIIMVGSVLMPVMDSMTHTESAPNEGASWARFGKSTSVENLNVSYDMDSTITITNGTDVQSGESQNMILYAASNAAIYLDDTDIVMLTADGVTTLAGDFTVAYDSVNDKVVVNDGSSYDLATPSWAYIPQSKGDYATFTDPGFKKGSGELLAVSEVFAGCAAFNELVAYDVPLTMDVTMTGDVVSSVKWVKPVSENNNDMKKKDTIIFDENQLKEIDTASLVKSVTTPTYTEGDWGYDLITSGDGNGKAMIVSYSGSGAGAITVPSTIGGYDVYQFGKGGSSETVFNTSISATDLIISDGVVKIADYAVNGCSGFTGTLTITSSVDYIGNYSFTNCSGFTGTLTIPSSVNIIGGGAFNSCNKFTKLILPSSLTDIYPYAFTYDSGFTGTLMIPSSVENIYEQSFRGCSGFTGCIICGSPTITGTMVFQGNTNMLEYLNLGDTTLTAGVNGINANASIRQADDAYLAASSYMALADLSVQASGPEQDILNAIPVLVIAAIVIMAAGVVIYNRME